MLDVGAGIGRVSRHVLLPLFEDVILLEPVDKFVREAHRSAVAGEWLDLPLEEGRMEKGNSEANRKAEQGGRGKRLVCIKGGLQGFDPAYPVRGGEVIGTVGASKGGRDVPLVADEIPVVYDV